MDNIVQYNRARVVRAIDKYGDMVRRICFVYLKNPDDVEDVFQDVFLQHYRHEKSFGDEEHEKAWLLRVSINKCKDLHKSFFRRYVCPLDDISITFEDEHESEVLQAVLALPPKYKDVIYLHYYEGYSVPEISVILCVKENTIYSLLHRARKILKGILEE